MNGRMYDPLLGRMLSPDPELQAPGDLQDYNRYSYVLNNPLRYTDPTGYDFWSAVNDYFSNPAHFLFVAESILSIASCVAVPGLGCALVGASFALFNGGVALGEGASFGQTSANIVVGFGISFLASSGVTWIFGPNANPLMAHGGRSGIRRRLDSARRRHRRQEDRFGRGLVGRAGRGQGALFYGVQKTVAYLRATEKVSLHLQFRMQDRFGNPIPDELVDGSHRQRRTS
jgi:hypothetical protein